MAMPGTSIEVPLGGNSWVVDDPVKSDSLITDNGIAEGWSDPLTRVRTYFHISAKGDLTIGIRARIASGTSTLKFIFENEVREVTLSDTSLKDILVGTFDVKKPGYHYLDIEGISKTDAFFAGIQSVLINGTATKSPVHYVKDDFYFGRRGPSVHLNYKIPEEASEVKWFYNEVNVPEGEDKEGSFFMANGFADGYFGIQVNSAEERRILFSVWSPYKTDDPGAIPPDYRVTLLKKGNGVTTGEFGNEGSGGQSYKKHFWKAGTTYKFLLKGEPGANETTDYTAYFFDPEINQWELIASFRRPKGSSWLGRLHSFLENFKPGTGNQSRKALYMNQWVGDATGKWHAITTATLSADATARKNARLDYAGGTERNAFFLKNCGFFDERKETGSVLNRGASGDGAPEIDFSVLP